MRLLDKLQRRFGRFGVAHVTEALIACQVLAYFYCTGQPEFLQRIVLMPGKVLEGEVWRLATFLCQPPLGNIVLAFFFWYMFYLMGTVLEASWGAFRYNLYLLLGWLATVAVAFVQPDAPAYAIFLQSSVFLAFAYLYPDFQFLIFFILPVKVKWLALIQWISYGLVMIYGDTTARLLILASVCNFFVFFGTDILLRMKAGRRRMADQSRQIRSANLPRHTCSVCGVTNISDPNMTFRYCSKCAGSPCYCKEHIHAHEHTPAPQEETVQV
jgi:hypothetical protein